MNQAKVEELGKHLQSARSNPGVPADARVFAFWDDRRREFPEHVDVGEERWRVVYAESELAIREALIDRGDDELLAIVTPLRARDLAHDVRARIARNRLFVFDPWESLLPLFQASSVDVRLRKNQALGRALLACSTTAGFKPATTGVLQRSEAWGAYFAHALGMDQEPEQIDGWAQWFIDHPREAASLVASEEGLAEDVLSRAVERCGEPVRFLFAAVEVAVEAGVSIGVRLHATAHAAKLAFDAGGGSDEEQKLGTSLLVRLEQFFGDQPVPHEELALLADEILRTETREGDVGAALDELLEQYHATALAHFSDISPNGYSARRSGLAAVAVGLLEGRAARTELVDALESLERHVLFTAEDASHRRRVRALARLSARMAEAGTTEHPPDAAGLARDYVEHGSFVDALRETLEQGDLGTHFAEAVTAVLAAAAAHSTERNRRFAGELQKQLTKGTHVSGTTPVHEMMRRVLAPLAGERAVLVLVIDGLSWFVLRDLSEDALFAKWSAFVPAKEKIHRPMLATVPSITNFSRTSLLSGELQTGGQNVEKKGFRENPSLVGKMRNSHRAVLFHQGELAGSGHGKVADEVATALRDRSKRVVGVVVNAVDDQLSGATQLAFDWKVETVAPLRSLMELALETERDILIVSDHGYVWDSKNARVEKGDSARYRTSDAPVGEGELEFRGPMLEAGGLSDGAVVAFDENIRYTSGQRGYHGGASLQEVVAPCVLLTQRDAPEAARWQYLVLDRPAWWEFRSEERTVQPVETVVASAPEENGQLSLIDGEESVTTHIDAPEWLEEFAASEVFRQRLQDIPSAPPEDQLIVLLSTIDANGGRAHASTLAKAVETGTRRVERAIPTIQRILNVEGFQVLEYDRNERLVRLNLEILKRQFHLREE